MKIYTLDPKKNKKVLAGLFIRSSGLFIKTVKKQHFMKLEQGYGIQEDVIDMLVDKGCKKIILKTPTKEIETNIEEWLLTIPKDYGNGYQRFLNLKERNKRQNFVLDNQKVLDI